MKRKYKIGKSGFICITRCKKYTTIEMRIGSIACEKCPYFDGHADDNHILCNWEDE
jgi:hypothetical protein